MSIVFNYLLRYYYNVSLGLMCLCIIYYIKDLKKFLLILIRVSFFGGFLGVFDVRGFFYVELIKLL